MAALSARGHHVGLFDDIPSAPYDCLVFAKTYSAADRALARTARDAGSRIVFDLCDNHFYNPFDLPRYRRARDELLEMFALSDKVIVTTEALAGVVRQETGGAVEPVVVGDVVDRIRLLRQARVAGAPLRLLWFGSHGSPNAPSGMSDLLNIQGDLEALAARTPVELIVCSNNEAKFDQLIRPLSLPSRYREWSMADFAEVLGEADAVILPVTLNPFTACKSHNRLTLALYAGLPVVATGIGSYREFEPYCTLDDWAGGLAALTQDYDSERRRALASRAHIDSVWSTDALGEAWEKALGLPPASTTAKAERKSKGGPHSRQLQGHLDVVGGNVVTGWVRDLRSPRRRVDVVLECSGEIAATGRTGLPRSDLRAAGMPDANCGFSLQLPEWCVSDPATIRVLAEGWLIEGRPIVPGRSTLIEPGVAPEARDIAAPSEVVMTPVTKLQVETAVEAQEALLEDISRIETLLEDFRRLAARAVVAFSESPELAGRAHTALGPQQIATPET